MPVDLSDSDDEPEPCATAYREACKETGKVACGKWLRACEGRSETCELQHYGIGKRGAVPLATSLRMNTYVCAIELSDNGLGSEGVVSIVEALLGGGAPALRSLDMSQNQAGPDGARALGDLLAEHTATDAGLASLRFDANAIGDRGAGFLARGLDANRSLQVLSLARNEIGCEGATQLSGPLGSSEATVTTLSLEWNAIRADGCRALVGACRGSRIERLDLGWNGVRDDACGAIAAALEDGATGLRELRLHHNHVSAEVRARASFVAPRAPSRSTARITARAPPLSVGRISSDRVSPRRACHAMCRVRAARCCARCCRRSTRST